MTRGFPVDRATRGLATGRRSKKSASRIGLDDWPAFVDLCLQVETSLLSLAEEIVTHGKRNYWEESKCVLENNANRARYASDAVDSLRGLFRHWYNVAVQLAEYKDYECAWGRAAGYRCFIELALKSDDPIIVETAKKESLRWDYNGSRFVYFIEAIGSDSIKIGTASDPMARLADLQTGCPFELVLLATVPGGYQLEDELHERFSSSVLRGEWFRGDPALRSYIQRLKTAQVES